MELEDVVLVDVLRLRRDGNGVAQQREAGQGVVILQEDGPQEPQGDLYITDTVN